MLFLVFISLCCFGFGKFHFSDTYGIFESCKVMKIAKRIWAGTADVETPTEPDEAQLFTFDSETPVWSSVCHDGHVAASHASDVLVALQYDLNAQIATLFVWKGLSKTPKWSAVVPNIKYPAETPAVAVSDDGTWIAVLGTDGTNAVLQVYNPDSDKPVQTWLSKKGLGAGTRHLDISSSGEVIAFHRAIKTGNTTFTVGIVVYDTKTKSARWEDTLTYSDSALGLSKSGEFLVFGFLDYDVYKWEGGVYKQIIHDKTTQGSYVFNSLVTNSGEFVLALSSYNGLDASIETFDKDGKMLWRYKYNPSFKYQNVPVAVAMTRDEKYFAVGSWGNSTKGVPDVLVFDFTSNKPVVEDYILDGQGSSFCVDIASTGKTLDIVWGGKTVHANVMGRGGELYFIQHDLS